jgi:hypothetical protein
MIKYKTISFHSDKKGITKLEELDGNQQVVCNGDLRVKEG